MNLHIINHFDDLNSFHYCSHSRLSVFLAMATAISWHSLLITHFLQRVYYLLLLYFRWKLLRYMPPSGRYLNEKVVFTTW